MVIYFWGIGKYKITSPWAVKSAPKGNPVLKKSKLHRYHSPPFSATHVTQQWAREKTQDGIFLCIQTKYLFSVQLLWLLKSSQKRKIKRFNGGISQRSQRTHTQRLQQFAQATGLPISLSCRRAISLWNHFSSASAFSINSWEMKGRRTKVGTTSISYNVLQYVHEISVLRKEAQLHTGVKILT